jgi:hypothetical protein
VRSGERPANQVVGRCRSLALAITDVAAVGMRAQSLLTAPDMVCVTFSAIAAATPGASTAAGRCEDLNCQALPRYATRRRCHVLLQSGCHTPGRSARSTKGMSAGGGGAVLVSCWYTWKSHATTGETAGQSTKA